MTHPPRARPRTPRRREGRRPRALVPAALLRRLAPLSIVVLASGCVAPDSAEPAILTPRERELGLVDTLLPNDVVQVEVFGYPEFSTPEGLAGQRVDNAGRVAVPLLERVPVHGLTIAEAERRIEDALASFLPDPSVSLYVIEFAPRYFWVDGQVGDPGAYSLERPTTALQGLAMGGGITPNAAEKEVALLRRVGDELEVHFFDADTPSREGWMYLRPGDFIFARRSGLGSFRQEVLPIIGAVGSSAAVVSSLLVLSDQLDDD